MNTNWLEIDYHVHRMLHPRLRIRRGPALRTARPVLSASAAGRSAAGRLFGGAPMTPRPVL